MDSRYRNRDFHAPQFGLTGRLTPPDSEQRDSLSLLHPSLGLAFTTHFTRGHDFLVIGDKAADNLPRGCDGCREELGGREICCQNPDNCFGKVRL